MGINPFSSHSLKLLILFPLLLPLPTNQELVSADISIGIGIGIGIGGGGNAPAPTTTPPSNCPPPPPPPPPTNCPPPPPAGPNPSDFVNLRQYRAYKVIQRFKRTITSDPNNITATWTGYRPCNYRGFACETPPKLKNTPTIASVDFNGFHLAAPTLSGFVNQFPDLAIFHANSNKFSGTVPDLTSLPYLFELDFSNNRLSGQFPSTLLPLHKLLFLDIRYNSFSGTVPSGIFLLGLNVLFLNNNGFGQPLPANLGASPVAYLTLANNGFTGSIPPSICNSSNTLIEVLFLNNRLSGCLPYEVGLLHKATVFDAGFNQITGTIPLSFGCLKKVEQLNLAGNLLYGEVPDVVCKLAKVGNLKNLTLSENYFTSVGSGCWELIKNKLLHVSKNCIPGLPNQRSASECAWFAAKPKYCPCLTYMPCALHRTSEVDDAVPLPSLETTLPRPGPASVAYNAVHSPHGK